MIKCSVCGKNLNNEKFCPNCGSVVNKKGTDFNKSSNNQIIEIVVNCPVCGKKVDNVKFCPNCGSVIDNEGIDLNNSSNNQDTKSCNSIGNSIDNDKESDNSSNNHDTEHSNITKNESDIMCGFAFGIFFSIISLIVMVISAFIFKGNTPSYDSAYLCVIISSIIIAYISIDWVGAVISSSLVAVISGLCIPHILSWVYSTGYFSFSAAYFEYFLGNPTIILIVVAIIISVVLNLLDGIVNKNGD